MSMLLFGAVVLACICFQSGLTQTLCEKDPNSYCICTIDDGTKRFFDLSPISSKDKPFFEVGEEDNLYYYDPCEPFNVAESGDACNGVAGCHNEMEGQDSTYTAIALHSRVVFSYSEAGENLILNYDNNAEDPGDLITLSVLLSCDANSESSVMEVTQSSGPAYQFLVISPYSCLQTPKSGKKGLSAGSVLCIIFSVLVVVYFVGGFIFMAVVQHKSGREAIPNYDFWIEVPGLIKEGATFTFTCAACKGEYSSSSPPVPEDQDGPDAFGGGDGGGGSTGNTKYDAI